MTEMTAQGDPQALVGTKIGDYDVLAWLGEGAHVHAYLVRHTENGKYFVVKTLKTNVTSSEESLERFKAEAQAALELDHPNVVKVHAYAQHGDFFYLVEEFFEGGSLMDKLKASQTPLPLDFTVRTLEDIARALDYAHAKGILHGDLKPENVLYAADGHAALSDLGVTKYRDDAEARSRQGLEFGNPGYMAPEEWQGGQVDARTDIYALGIILFEMLTGQLPFESSKTASVIYIHLLHLMASPISVLELRKDLPPTIEPVIAKAIEKDREKRYTTAGELVEAFKAALAVSASPVNGHSPKDEAPKPAKTSNIFAAAGTRTGGKDEARLPESTAPDQKMTASNFPTAPLAAPSSNPAHAPAYTAPRDDGSRMIIVALLIALIVALFAILRLLEDRSKA
ncbi:MAG: hypothetical protein OHK0023_25130 [Anaerolineae bacterium]